MDEDLEETLELDVPDLPAREEEEPVQKVTDLPQGAKRDGYFKKRDYDG